MIESNIEDLTEEKALIRSGHEQLATMTEDIQKKLGKKYFVLFVTLNILSYQLSYYF